MRKPVLTLVTTVAALLLLAACGNDTTGGGTTPTTESSPTAASFNDADVTFAKDMIVHHRQAVEMATLAETRAEDPQVKELAANIKKAQDPEIQTMSGWLEAWGEEVPEEMEGHSMGGEDMPGMMTMEEMDQLEAAKGAAFDKAFMEMMIKHHEGAIEMAKTEQADGQSAEAKELAATIERVQAEEIATMNRLLGNAS